MLFCRKNILQLKFCPLSLFCTIHQVLAWVLFLVHPKPAHFFRTWCTIWWWFLERLWWYIHTYNFFVKSFHTIIYFKIFQYGNNNKKNDANNEDELSKLEELKFSPSNESNEVNDSEKKDISTAVASSSTASSMTSTASPTIPNNAQLNSTSSHSRQSSQVSNFTKKNDKRNSFFNL